METSKSAIKGSGGATNRGKAPRARHGFWLRAAAVGLLAASVAEIDTAGDGFLMTFDAAERAIRCACAIREGLLGLGLEIRAGLHTGEVERQGGAVSGQVVHAGARVMAVAAPGEIIVSSVVRDVVAGSALRFAERGTRQLRGLPGDWQLYAVEL